MNSDKYTVNQISAFIRKELQNYYSKREIQQFVFLLFNHTLGFSKLDIVLRSGEVVDEKTFMEFSDYIFQLKQFRPIQYILGETVFYNLYLKINPSVLIPRPETEELVSWIINEKIPLNSRILDVGTGSGCIAIALTHKIPGIVAEAVDLSGEALKLAQENAEKHKVNIYFSQENILEPSETLKKKVFDLIVSNPPYVTKSEKKKMHKNVIDYEPHLALFVEDSTPLKYYDAILAFAASSLTNNGLIFFEINESFHKEIVALMKNHNFAEIELRKDINNKFRMIRGRKSSTHI